MRLFESIAIGHLLPRLRRHGRNTIAQATGVGHVSQHCCWRMLAGPNASVKSKTLRPCLVEFRLHNTVRRWFPLPCMQDEVSRTLYAVVGSLDCTNCPATFDISAFPRPSLRLPWARDGSYWSICCKDGWMVPFGCLVESLSLESNGSAAATGKASFWG